MDAYSQASKALFEVFNDTTPFVEGLSIDEAFLDVGGLRLISGTPTEIAVRLRRDVLEKVGLPVTVGVARTKFLAKVASGVAKPDGLLVVPTDGELEFLHPLPVERLWGVGPVTATKLRDRFITTVGEVAQLGESALVRMLGRAAGRHIHALPAGPCGPPSPLDGDAARAGPKTTITRNPRRRPRRAGRPIDAQASCGSPSLPHRRASVAL
jgi:DNA polymerase-4